MTEDNTQTVDLQSVLNISNAGELHIQLMSLLDAGNPIVINAEEVERVDAAVLQLLCAFVATAANEGVGFEWSEVSPALQEAAQLTGMTGALQMPESAG